jgi:uncharacterized protein YecE (DUF72 family)
VSAQTDLSNEARKSGEVRIGISGWRYKGWRGAFYPQGLPQKRELEYASGIFGSVEINGTFYSLQRPESFARWADATPDDFVFAVKGSRYITHMLRLTKMHKPLANFFASGVLRLGYKLGPILWQFPPQFRFNAEKLERFFKLLPQDINSAAAMARRHDKRVSGRSWLRATENRKLRHAVEIRHPSFVTPEFIKLLRRYEIALVCADTVSWPRLMDVTSDFVYCRLHGSEELYASGYDSKSLDEWAVRVAAWSRGSEPHDAERVIDESGPKRTARDVYLYFDNDAKVRAPFDAQGLIERVAALLRERSMTPLRSATATRRV